MLVASPLEDFVRSISTLASSIERSGIRDLMDLAREMEGRIIHLEVGEPSFITPAHIIEAAFEKSSAGSTRYTQSGGILPLRTAIAERYSAKWDKPVTPNMVMASHGGVNAINSTVFALIDRGDEVLVPDPGWPNYRSILNLAGGVPVAYPMTVENSYLPHPEQIEALITPRTKMIITCNPGNPTGAVWPAETVSAIVELARKHDLYVLADEIYEELVFEGEHFPAASFDDDRRVVSVSGFSKTYAMTGWRLGWAIADEELIKSITKMMEPLISCPSSVSQEAGVAALTGTQQPVAVMRDAYRNRREIAAEVLEPAGLLPVRPNGAFYAIVDLRDCRIPSRELAIQILKEKRVASAPGDTFGKVLADGFVRISLASPDDDVREGCERLVAFRYAHS
jgi:aspartate/methionine/tyrosine aminotransferase